MPHSSADLPVDLRRRETTAALLATPLAFASTAAHAAAPEAHAPALEFAFAARVTLGPPLELGTRAGRRSRFVPITGGEVAGPRLTAKVLAGGGDRQEIGDDGVTIIHARYMLQATDGAIIAVDNPGVRVASPEVIARLTAGEDLAPDLYYFRTTPSFEAPLGPHDWLRQSVFVCSGIRHPNDVELRIYRVA
jgi:hypothetical protein